MVGLDLGDSLPTKTHQAFVIEADGNFRTRRMGNAFLDAVIFQPYLEMLCPFSDKIATGLGIIPFSQMQVCSQISATE